MTAKKGHDPCNDIIAAKTLLKFVTFIVTMVLLVSSLAWKASEGNSTRVEKLERRADVIEERSVYVKDELTEIKSIVRELDTKLDDMRAGAAKE